MYIHERADWTHFRWDDSKVSLMIEEIGRKQGLLYGRLSNIGFDNKVKAMAENLTKDVVYSSEIEGMRVTEGPQAYLSHVRINGNTRLYENVVRRELRKSIQRL